MGNRGDSVHIVNSSSNTSPYPEVCWAEISIPQLHQNIRIVKSCISKDTKFMAVMKGNAYGHGLLPLAYELEREGQCDYIGVVRLTEAIDLRNAGINLKILVMSPLMPEQTPWVVKHKITPMVDSLRFIQALDNSAKAAGQKAFVHLKVNTGLNRYGIEPHEVEDFLTQVKQQHVNIYVEGIYTHFRDAEYNGSFTRHQLKGFTTLLRSLEGKGLRPPIAHAAGSGGILMYPESHLDMVRCGIVLYGISPKEDDLIVPEGIKPIMSIKGHILKILSLKTNEYAGYGSKFKASRDSRIAIVGAGYGDGISRGWKNILIHGCKLPVTSYFMDGVMVDITDMQDLVKEYDEAVLVGCQGKEAITWEDACSALGVNPDEQLQRITARVPRHYV